MVLKTAERIKELREANGFTQSGMARKLSVTRSTVNAWEMGTNKPSIDKLSDIADLFQVTTDFLIGRSNAQIIDVSYLDNDGIEVTRRLLHYMKAHQKYMEENKNSGQ